MQLHVMRNIWRGLERRATKWAGGHPSGDPALLGWNLRQTKAGVEVTEQVALSGTAVLCAVRNISEAVGMAAARAQRMWPAASIFIGLKPRRVPKAES